MSQIPVDILGAEHKLNTTADANGLPLGEWVVLQDIMLDQGNLRRRGGTQRVMVAPVSNLCMDLNGTTQIVTVPVNAVIHTLRKAWTVYFIVQPDTVAAARTLLGWVHATDWPIQVQFTSGAVVQVKVTDSAGTVTTMTGTTTLVGGTTYSVVVVRAGTALTVYLNGVSEATGTMADLDCKAAGGNMTLGAANAAGFFDGKYETCWAVNVADTYMGDIFLRCIDPKAETVLWCYTLENMESATTNRIDDDSRFENHGGVTAGTSTATSIARQTMPVTLLAPYGDKNTKPRLMVVAGNKMFLAEIGV